MVPSVWLQQIKLIKDADALVRKIQAESRLLGYSPTPSEVENWRTKFLANLHETYRRAMRGEYYYALKSLDNLRLAMALAWYMEQGIQPNAYGDWAHYEGDRSRLRLDQQTLLSTWHCQRDGSEMIAVCRQIVPEFLKVNRSLCGKTGIEENQEKLLEMIRLVL
jgi:hypothetical protein